MSGIWQEDFPVRWRDADLSGRLSLQAAAAYFQEAAISHAESLGVGKDILAQARQGWVLSRMTLVLDKRPRWKDTVTVRSWPRGVDRLFAVRDYSISRGEELLARGRSGWLVIDLDKKRPLRPRTVMEPLPENAGLDALSGSPLGLEARQHLEKAAERQALYPDIDFHGHMNNARYISWIEEIAPEGMLAGAGAIRLDINYLAEVLAGDRITLFSAPADAGDPAALPSAPAGTVWENALAFEGRRLSGEPVFRAELRTGPEAVQGGTPP